MLANAAWIYACMVIQNTTLLFLDANYSRGHTGGSGCCCRCVAGWLSTVAKQQENANLGKSNWRDGCQ